MSSEKVEALLEIMASFLEEDVQKTSPREDVAGNSKPPVQIHIHHCPECESAIVQTSKGELEFGNIAGIPRSLVDSAAQGNVATRRKSE